MEKSLDSLAARIVDLRFSKLDPSQRLLVCIAGVPGSGKSTIAYPLVEKINLLLSGDPTIPDVQIMESGEEFRKCKAICIGLDGWHYSLDELDRFPDPVEARRIRGAPSTFNSPLYTNFVSSLLSRSRPSPSISFPTFSHSLKDPVISPFNIESHHTIVVIEGLYTLLNTPEWKINEQMDLKVWVECSREIARSRLIKRHLLEGVEQDLEAAERRGEFSFFSCFV